LPSPNCAKSPQFFLTAPGDSRLPKRFSSSPLLRHLAHLPHLLLHPQDLSELTASDHAPPPPSNASASDRTTTSTLLCHSGELHRLPPCPAGRSCPINALPRCRSPPHQLSCRRWSGHRASLVRGDGSSARANRAGVTSQPGPFSVWAGPPWPLVPYQAEPATWSAWPRPWKSFKFPKSVEMYIKFIQIQNKFCRNPIEQLYAIDLTT
jgi:hypothetical protein